MLVEFVTSGGVASGRTLEVGSGTGTNSIWLAERGFDVLGVDVSPLAVEKARAKIKSFDLPCRFATLDFLVAPPANDRFHFVFDRGCFHVFDESEERSRFAECVATALEPGGLWLSLMGSTEGPPREVGPPRRSAHEIIVAIEPVLEILELRSAEFRAHDVKAWFCLSRQRTISAQPSSRHDGGQDVGDGRT